jgi:hypothetical protein
MSSRNGKAIPADDSEPEPKGPNLILMYTLLALALLAAISFAVFIVHPFYIRR